MKSKFIIFVSFTCFLVASNAVFGQTVTDDEPDIIPSNSSGEVHSAITDVLTSASQQSNERLFVVARLGTGEISRRVNLNRLRLLKSYLSSRASGSRKPVFAEGERAEGEGRIEYYLGSRLWLITFALKNKIPKYTCCDDYIPLAKKKLKRKKRKI